MAELRSMATGSTFDAITADTLGSLELPAADAAEQRRIAYFLDDRVARIDQIITARSQQLVFVQEVERSRREAIAMGATVTGTERGGKWEAFGAVPSHWGEARLRDLRVLVQTGPFGSQLHSDEYVEDGWPVVNPASLTDYGIEPARGMTVNGSVRERLLRHILKDGDIVFGRRGEMGRAALVTASESGWLCGTGSLLVRLADPRVLPEYLVALLRTRALRYYFTRQSVGSTMENLNTDILLGMPILLPPVEQQRALLTELDSVSAVSRNAARDLASSVRLLQEYKQSLITAAVTGEFDVTTAGRGIQG